MVMRILLAHGQIAFIEVDGPQHFVNGMLRRKDIMKEQLYRTKFPEASFTRVKYDVVNKLGSRKVASDVAKYITVTCNRARRRPTCESC